MHAKRKKKIKFSMKSFFFLKLQVIFKMSTEDFYQQLPQIKCKMHVPN